MEGSIDLCRVITFFFDPNQAASRVITKAENYFSPLKKDGSRHLLFTDVLSWRDN